MQRRFIALSVIAVLAIVGLFGFNAVAQANFKVGITIQSLENSYWAGVFGEVEQIMKEKGWEYTILDCNDNSAVQIQQIENFITSGVDRSWFILPIHTQSKTTQDKLASWH